MPRIRDDRMDLDDRTGCTVDRQSAGRSIGGQEVYKMKKTLYTFLLWDFLLFAMGLSEILFYRSLTLGEGARISWTQPALVSLTSFLILLSVYYGLYQFLFGKRFYLKTEMKP